MSDTSVLTIDTHAAFVRLVGAGASEDMARTIVDMHVGILTSGLATRADIAELRGDIREFRTATKVDFDALRTSTKDHVGKVRDEITEPLSAGEIHIEKLRTENGATKLSPALWFVSVNIALFSLVMATVKSLILQRPSHAPSPRSGDHIPVTTPSLSPLAASPATPEPSSCQTLPP